MHTHIHTHTMNCSHFSVDSDYKVLLIDMTDLARDLLSKESLHNYIIFSSTKFFVYLCSCVLHHTHYVQCLIQFYALLICVFAGSGKFLSKQKFVMDSILPVWWLYCLEVKGFVVLLCEEVLHKGY